MIRHAFNDHKVSWFRDERQRAQVRMIVMERLADDLYQQECRYLMRFWWHLEMTYQEVSYEELKLHLSGRKMEVLETLFDAIEGSHSAVDEWISQQQKNWPRLESATH